RCLDLDCAGICGEVAVPMPEAQTRIVRRRRHDELRTDEAGIDEIIVVSLQHRAGARRPAIRAGWTWRSGYTHFPIASVHAPITEAVLETFRIVDDIEIVWPCEHFHLIDVPACGDIAIAVGSEVKGNLHRLSGV